MEAEQLKAVTRTEAGKGPARRLRSKGMIPAILYGPHTDSMKLAVNAAELKRLLVQKDSKKFFRLQIEDNDEIHEKLSIVKSFDRQPLGGQLIHADFYEISMDQKISLDIPVHLVGIPEGVEFGGELLQHRRVLRVSCLPALLPEGIDIDVTRLAVGDSVKIKDIHLAEGITIMDPEDVTVAFVATTRATLRTPEEAAAAAPAAQPEAPKQKAPEKKAPEKKK